LTGTFAVTREEKKINGKRGKKKGIDEDDRKIVQENEETYEGESRKDKRR
jgi:hypothetical protein